MLGSKDFAFFCLSAQPGMLVTTSTHEKSSKVEVFQRHSTNFIETVKSICVIYDVTRQLVCDVIILTWAVRHFLAQYRSNITASLKNFDGF